LNLEYAMSEFQNKVVIVTGGAKGIGSGICRAFSRDGAHVLCADVDVKAGERLAAESGSLSGQIRFQEADVAQNDACRSLARTAVSEWGGVDILCNNVGVQPTSSYVPAHELSEEAWDYILNVNLKSAFLMIRHCVPEMIKRGGGVIINTASVQGLQSTKGVCAYAASKGGILSLTRQLALEYAGDNVRVLAVSPGTIDTPLVDEALQAMGGNETEHRERMSRSHPIGRIGTPDDIAQAVLFLASEKASFMTGENVCVDGGMMAKGAWS
jgi:NAD(P)-dependent dehydrogenase (short-subunit alcohol dehydrogenase family)